MARVRSTGWVLVGLSVCAAVGLGGCGGGVKPGNRSAPPPGAGPPAPPYDGEPGTPGPPWVDPPLPPEVSGAISVFICAYPQAGSAQPGEPCCIESVRVETRSDGDQFDVSGAHAEVRRADGTVQAVTMQAAPEGSQIVLTQMRLTPSADKLNTVAIDGPVRVQPKYGGGECVVGALEFGVECLADGTVVAPRSIHTHVPMTEDARLDYLYVGGLSPEPRDWLKVIVVDNYGGRSETPPRKASGWGEVGILVDGRGASYQAVSGPDSVLSLLFARTDGDGDGIPDLLQ